MEIRLYACMAVCLSICPMEAMILQYLARQHACKVDNFWNDRGWCRWTDKPKPVFLFYVFIQKTCFRRGFRKAWVVFSVVSREKRLEVLRAIIFDGNNFLRLSAFSSDPFRLKCLVFCLVVEGKTIWQSHLLKPIFCRRHKKNGCFHLTSQLQITYNQSALKQAGL